MKYIVPKEIKSETQVVWSLYLQDGAFLLIWGLLNFILKERVHDMMRIPFFIFCIIIGIRLVLRSPGNPKRRYYQAVALYLTRPKNIYRYFKEADENEGKRDQAHQGRHTYHRV